MMVSPPRRCASTMIERRPASCASARAGARLARSVRRVIANRVTAPIGRRHPEPGVDEEADGQEHRDPGQIDDGDRARTGQKAADRIEVADRLGRLAGVPVLATDRRITALCTARARRWSSTAADRTTTRERIRSSTPWKA